MMFRIGRRIPEKEMKNNDNSFNEEEKFTDVLKKEQILNTTPKTIQEYTFLYSEEQRLLGVNKFKIRETSRFLEYSSDLKIIFSIFIDLDKQKRSYM